MVTFLGRSNVIVFFGAVAALAVKLLNSSAWRMIFELRTDAAGATGSALPAPLLPAGAALRLSDTSTAFDAAGVGAAAAGGAGARGGGGGR